ncbi:hypothetical protein [Deinococcus soli (ex Cha et al. 2016)]|uniref:hypothetical protein n=1 Tax=Deinococcus soli (ex Cha et al. 2016) TaxID=1309411 RepID=UPI00166C150F|nr:hypothetical protein [Deinococcus soli (ex Cha et al. 2016)]GGB84848.1 hypothetical protein GCM10008019_46030 [Deinococcus soli (ex Cha et al. 2016)]
MPLTARLNGTRLISVDLTPEAFEVQRSVITLADLHARQATYRQSGVRGLQLMRTHEQDLRLGQVQPWQADTPALYLTEAHTVPALGLTLPELVHVALGGHLMLFPAWKWALDLDVQQEPSRCPVYTRTHRSACVSRRPRTCRW